MISNVEINEHDDFTDCDGKKCGLGKHVSGGYYVCPHNNLSTKHPELIKQWHPDNKPMNSYTSKSNQKVWWICELNPCGCHIWPALISSRTKKNPTGCPYCTKNPTACIHNNLEVQFPHLKIEWDPNNLKKMCEYTSCSQSKVLWICKDSPCECHKWPATIANRTKKDKPTGCPYCCKNRNPCIHYNLELLFPHLKIEWDPNNLKPMNKYTPHSGNEVLWICKESPCDCHKWKTFIYSRTDEKTPTGCPYCKQGKVCEHNNLEILFPQLKIEWDPKNTKQMSEYAPHSGNEVSWICKESPCDCHIWEATINDRTRKNKPIGCPFCKQGKVCEHNNLEVLFPHLKIEWDPDNSKLMKEFSFGSNTKVKWICSKNPLHRWPTPIDSRTKKDGTNCPHCSKSKGYSKAEINWLTSIEQRENIIIRNALNENGQFKIIGVGKVDGYCEKNNTVYEFNGDFWHGNPSIYDRDEINPVTKSTFGELYDKTIAREQKIRDLGFNLIVKWETDCSDIEQRVEELDEF
jgi:hypothetical protein